MTPGHLGVQFQAGDSLLLWKMVAGILWMGLLRFDHQVN
jgi:hypothetical protein